MDIETMENAVISSNIKFGSTASAKYVGLNKNEDLEMFSQGNVITFKGNNINISTASGTTVLIDTGININKPCHSDCSVTFNNAKYMRGTTTQNTTHDILGLSSTDNVNVGSNSLNTRLRGKSIYLRDTSVSVTSDKNLKKTLILSTKDMIISLINLLRERLNIFLEIVEEHILVLLLKKLKMHLMNQI